MRVLVVACVVIAMNGCASRGVAVRCDGALQPINAPAASATRALAAAPTDPQQRPTPARPP